MKSWGGEGSFYNFDLHRALDSRIDGDVGKRSLWLGFGLGFRLKEGRTSHLL